MPIGPARMPLIDHLGELRRRMMIIVVCLFVTLCVLYFISDKFILFLVQPIIDFLPEGSLENGTSQELTSPVFTLCA